MRSGWVVVVVWAVWCGCVGYCWDQGSKCRRAPLGTEYPRAPGDNDYFIDISGNPNMYVPGEIYTVNLKGMRQGLSVQKFTGFMLVVEALQSPINIYGPQSVGTFQLYGDALTMHSDDCPNAVIQTSSIAKSEIQVLWTAPPAGSGCVIFKATVVVNRDQWYMDDGKLAKELCEEVQENEDMQPDIIYDCCACDEAKYEVTFEGQWSRHTHPKDFPTNEWLTHFSDIIGASHSSNYRVWDYGGYSSDGLRQVAEWGSTRTLESELKRQSDHIRTIIKARGLWYPNVNGKTFAVFRVDNRHHLMSLVSMLGPSPDWIVGVSALELCLRNCSWVDQKTLNLYPWDAGTDSGETYDSANAPTIPREKIRRITNSYPSAPKSPFYDPAGLPMKPLARLTITRQRVYEKSCSDNSPLIRDLRPYEDDDSTRPECQVGSWTHWSQCSRTCGKGLRKRSRTYIMPMKARMSGCRRQIEENEMCAGVEPICPGGNQDNFFGTDNLHNYLPPGEPDARVCATNEWSTWTPCSATCGEGHRMRNRRYLDRMGRKKCQKDTTQKEVCVADIECAGHHPSEVISPECAVTQWTDWSPCSATCGEGTTLRTRYYLVPMANQGDCDVNTMDKRSCVGDRRNCSIDPSERAVADCDVFRRLNLSIHDQMQFEVWCKLGREKTAEYTHSQEVCQTEKEEGPCRGYFRRWYYDIGTSSCKEFTFGGCRGNRNNFESFDDCMAVCSMFKPTQADPVNIQNQPSRHGLNSGSHSNVVDCMVTPWSDWGPCSVTCGRGRTEKTRMIKVEAENGGRKCPKKLVRGKRCNTTKCNKGHGGLVSASLRRDSFVHYEPEVQYEPPQNQHVPNYEPYGEYISPALFNPPPLEERAQQHIYLHEPAREELYDDGTKADCMMSEWGPWSPCTHSCGGEALQQRSRTVIVSPRNGGSPCGDHYERRYCILPPCPQPRG